MAFINYNKISQTFSLLPKISNTVGTSHIHGHLTHISQNYSHEFLGAFENLRKATMASLCLCPSVRTSVRVDQLGSHWTDFH
jgi:hypothetical protein